jgi:hypothetical protein
MQSIFKILLFLSAPFSGYLTASIMSLPGKAQSNRTIWINWAEGDPLHEHFKPIQAQVKLANNSANWQQIYSQLDQVPVQTILNHSDEMGRYYNNVALAAYYADRQNDAKSNINKARDMKPSHPEVRNAIAANLSIII